MTYLMSDFMSIYAYVHVITIDFYSNSVGLSLYLPKLIILNFKGFNAVSP
jgi:hypothetical protein